MTITNNEGFYQADLGNIDDRYHDGDVIQASIIYCEALPRCAKTTIVSGGGNQITFDIAKDDVADTATIVKYVCDDGSIVLDKSLCVIQPRIYECADGTLVEDEDDCPETSNSWIYWVIGIFLALFGAGAGGWKIYNGKFKHYHKGLTSYHDPSTRHLNPKYRHTLWKDNAIKCISDVKKIQSGIDLSQ